MSVVFRGVDRLVPRPSLDILAIPVEHSLIGWMLVGGVAELLATTSLTTYHWYGGWQWHGSFSHCSGAPFAGTLVFNLAWWMIFNTAIYLWFYRRVRDGWRISLAWLNIFTVAVPLLVWGIAVFAMGWQAITCRGGSYKMIVQIYLVWLLAVVEWLLVGNSVRQMSLSYSPRGPIALWEDPAV